MPEHLHLLIEMPPWLDVVEVVRRIKGATSRQILERFPDLRLREGRQAFWARGYHYERHTDATLNRVIHYIEDQHAKAIRECPSLAADAPAEWVDAALLCRDRD